MKVLHLLNYGWPWIDGYTVRSQGLISAQARVLGWTVRVATSRYEPLTRARDERATTPAWSADQDRLGLPAAPWERPGLGLAPRAERALAADLRRLLERDRPDLVHLHHPHYVARPALRAARALGLPAVYEIRCFNGDYDLARAGGGPKERWARARGARFNQLEHRVCRAADGVVTISDGLAARVRRARKGLGGEDGVFVVRNSVDPRWLGRSTRHSAQEATQDSTARDRAVHRAVHIGYATTFARIESLDRLVEAFVDLDADAARLAIAGGGDDWRRIDALVDRLGARAQIELPGFVPFSQMGDFLGGLDLFVVPRMGAGPTRETPPLKPLEALAAGVPVLAPSLPALRELLERDGRPRRGVRFYEPTPEGLRAGLRRALDEPLEAPADDAVADRTWEREVRRYVDVYRAAGVAVDAPRAASGAGTET